MYVIIPKNIKNVLKHCGIIWQHTVKWFRNTKRYIHIYKYTALLDIKVNTTYTNNLSIYMKKLYQLDLIISEESYQTLNHNSLTVLSQDT